LLTLRFSVAFCVLPRFYHIRKLIIQMGGGEDSTGISNTDRYIQLCHLSLGCVLFKFNLVNVTGAGFREVALLKGPGRCWGDMLAETGAVTFAQKSQQYLN
jgi:hypothetical protein